MQGQVQFSQLIPSLAAAPSNTIVNTATVSTASAETNTANNTAADSIQISVDVQVVKTVDNVLPTAGSTIIYTITVTNNSPFFTASNVVMSDVLPTEFTHTGNSGGYDPVGGTWTIGTLAPSTSTTLTITGTINGALVPPYSFSNTASIAATEVDTIPGNNSSTASVSIPSADIALAATPSTLFPAPGETVTMDILVSNAGINDATNVVINPFTTIPFVGAGGSASQTGITVGTIPLTDPSGTTYPVTLTAVADQYDPNTGDNSVSFTLTVNDAPATSDDFATTPFQTALVIDILGNDSDAYGGLDVSSVSIVGGASNGATSAPNPVTGAITYTPAFGFSGNDSFTYQVCDIYSQCNTAIVFVTVSP